MSSSSASTTYKALQCVSLGKTFEEGIRNIALREVPRQKLGENDVRIKTEASCLNFFDLLMLVGRYQHKPKLPFTLGSEASGVVVEVGSNVTNVKVGDEVVIGMAQGCLAEELVVNSMFCFPKPSVFSHEEAAGIIVGFCTAYHGLVQRGHIKEGEYVLVTGAGGGMGLAAIQLAKLLGAKVIAAASSDEKLKTCQEMGADFTLNYAELKDAEFKKKIEEFTQGRWVDVCYELVGGQIFDQCVRCMGDQGRLLIVGFASGKIPQFPVNLALVKGFSVVGVRAGESMRRHPELAMEMFDKLKEWTSSGKLKPRVVFSYDKHHVQAAFSVLATRSAIGKIVIVWNPKKKEKAQTQLQSKL